MGRVVLDFQGVLVDVRGPTSSAMDQHELDPDEVTDEDLAVNTQDELGDLVVDREATARRATFSQKLHFFLANLTTESARLTVRQNYESNGVETWRRLVKKYSLPDATRHVSRLTQLLDSGFQVQSQNFEQDFNTWETFNVKLPDSVLVATLLKKNSGPLQQHLRLNARNLTYEDVRATILEYHQSRHILTGAASSSQGPAPMDRRT